MKQLIKKNYGISNRTMAIISKDTGNYQSVILEQEQKIYGSQKPSRIVQESCLAGGASFQGRRAAVKKLAGTNRKLPVLINRELCIYMLPLTALKNKESIWVAYQHVKSYQAVNKHTQITLSNQMQLEVNMSISSFTRLFDRTSTIILRQNHRKFFSFGTLST